ncbi:MAG TPA: hypothetical protein VHC22_12285 [Pirellulales bacterium]|nr:hypothetical protein [Pirellulales bacterium]
MSRYHCSMRALLVAALVAGVFGAAMIQEARQNALAVDQPTGQPALWSGQPLIEQPSTQIVFAGPEGMNVTWDVTALGEYDSEPLVAPGRYNFPQGAIYRLKLTKIPGHEGIEIYPFLEVAPALPNSKAYLDAGAVPVYFTDADLDDIVAGRPIMNVIYLPDVRDVSGGVEVVVMRTLEPGMDPIVEADRIGTILVIVRLQGTSIWSGSAAPSGL